MTDTQTGRIRHRILLVEDDPEDVMLLRETLDGIMDWSVDLTVCSRVEEAKAMLGTRTFDAILLDVRLPNGSGVAVFHAIAEAAPTTAIIALTGMDDPRFCRNIMDAGATYFLHKRELTADALVRTIPYAIEKAAQLARLARGRAELNATLAVMKAAKEEFNAALDAVLPLLKRT